MKLSRQQIQSKVEARESFWVSSSPERKAALNAALILGLHYVTSSDGHGGFHIMPVPVRKAAK